MFDELGISSGTAIILLVTMYFLIKLAVRGGIKDAYKDITGKQTAEEKKVEDIINSASKNIKKDN